LISICLAKDGSPLKRPSPEERRHQSAELPIGDDVAFAVRGLLGELHHALPTHWNDPRVLRVNKGHSKTIFIEKRCKLAGSSACRPQCRRRHLTQYHYIARRRLQYASRTFEYIEFTSLDVDLYDQWSITADKIDS